MAFSRRIFLRHGVLAAAACAGSPLLALGRGQPIGGNEEAGSSHKAAESKSGNWQDHSSALDHIGREAFAGAVGTNFKVFLSAGDTAAVWVTLLAVEDLPRIAPANTGSFAVANKASAFTPTSNGFVLVLGGSSALPQATHLFEHDVLGRFAMFTVPDGNGQQLHTAVINRLDAAHIVAVPYRQNQTLPNQTPQNQAPGAASGGINGSAGTSAEVETHFPPLAGSQGVRRDAAKD